MHTIDVDLAGDRFDVAFDPKQVSVAGLLRVIRDLDYEPEVVDAPGEPLVVAERIDVTALPEDLRALFVEAGTKKKAVLVEFSGPG